MEYYLEETKDWYIISDEKGNEKLKINRHANSKEHILMMFPELKEKQVEEKERLVKTDYGWLDTKTGVEYATEEEFYESIKED